jgi:enediyne biosynthesis protein E4
VLSEKHSGRGLALGDLYNDGRLEALVNNMNERPSLYRNTAEGGNFISLQLIGTKSNRAALGAQVTVQTVDGPRTQEVRSGGGYISQNDLRLHFGLGHADKAEKVTIRWPSGLSETLPSLAANHFYVVREAQGIDSARTRGVRQIKFPAPSQAPK